MPDYLRAHEPLWSCDATAPDVARRRSATSAFTGHRRVAAYALGAGGLFFASPNTDRVAQPPVVTSCGLPQTYSDGRWGPLEWTRVPQILREDSEHRICTYQLQRPDALDPAFVTPSDKKEFTTFDYNSRRGRLHPSFLDALLAMRDSENLAALRAAKDDASYHAVLAHDEAADAALARLHIDHRTLEDTRIDVAAVQRRILDLRAFTAWVTLRRAWNEGWLWEPLPVFPVVGAWLDYGHVLGPELLRLTFLGIPCWYSVAAFSPPIGARAVDLAPYPQELSFALWDEDLHHPSPESKRGKANRRGLSAPENARTIDQLSGEDDFDEPDWEADGRSSPARIEDDRTEPVESQHLERGRSRLRSPQRDSRSASPRSRSRAWSPPRRPSHSTQVRRGWGMRGDSYMPNYGRSSGRRTSGYARSAFSPPRRRSRSRSLERQGATRRQRDRSPANYWGPRSRRRRPSRSPSPSWRQPRSRSRSSRCHSPPLWHRRRSSSPRRQSPRPARRSRSPRRYSPPRRESSLTSRRRHASPGRSTTNRSRSCESAGRRNYAEVSPRDSPTEPGDELPRRSLLDRLGGPQRLSLLDRFDSPPPLRSRASSFSSASAVAAENDVRDPLSYVPDTPFNAEAPDRDVSRLRPKGPRPRFITYDKGRVCRTYLPIREGAEVRYFLEARFEDDVHTQGVFVPWAHASEELPRLPPAGLTPVPPGRLMMAGQLGLQRAILWKWYSFKYLSGVMTRDPDEDLSLWTTPAQWRRRLRGGKEFRERLPAHRTTPSDEALDALHLGPATADDCVRYAWELDTFLFRADFERLTAFKHRAFNRAPLLVRPRLWVELRDRIRRVWGSGLNYFPSVSEPAFLDSDDELLRLRHWRALGRIMLEWDVTERRHERILVAMGGTVTEIEQGLCKVFNDVHLLVYNRDSYPFTYRPDLVV